MENKLKRLKNQQQRLQKLSERSTKLISYRNKTRVQFITSRWSAFLKQEKVEFTRQIDNTVNKVRWGKNSNGYSRIRKY